MRRYTVVDVDGVTVYTVVDDDDVAFFIFAVPARLVVGLWGRVMWYSRRVRTRTIDTTRRTTETTSGAGRVLFCSTTDRVPPILDQSLE